MPTTGSSTPRRGGIRGLLVTATMVLAGGALLAPSAASASHAVGADGVSAGNVSQAAPAKVGKKKLRRKIQKVARKQLTIKHRRHEHGGHNCNFYSAALKVGSSTACSNGWRSEQWCADFAKWVYRRAGANVKGLTPAALSGRDYGKRHHTWHKRKPHVGDLAVLNSKHHIGIVVKVLGHGKFRMISGNTWNKKHTAINAVKAGTYTVGGMLGFASPARR